MILWTFLPQMAQQGLEYSLCTTRNQLLGSCFISMICPRDAKQQHTLEMPGNSELLSQVLGSHTIFSIQTNQREVDAHREKTRRRKQRYLAGSSRPLTFHSGSPVPAPWISCHCLCYILASHTCIRAGHGRWPRKLIFLSSTLPPFSLPLNHFPCCAEEFFSNVILMPPLSPFKAFKQLSDTF